MKILIITNHSYMLYRFRKELIAELMKEHEVVLGMPFVGHEEDFQAMGLRCIDTDIDRRGINPKTDLKLMVTYRKLLKEECPDLVITYSIKPNIYMGLLCAVRDIPYYVNVQGLGAAFQKESTAKLVTVLYKAALRKAKTVFFENRGNAQEFITRKIIPDSKVVVLNGAGVNLDEYGAKDYPDHDKVHFLYLGRFMKEKGIEELCTAARRLHREMGDRVVLDLVGFFDDDTCEELINQLVADGIASFSGFQSEPRPYYAAADCVVMPSYHEGMSNVLLEAAAIGRPVITTDIHGCKEAVDDGKSGLLCRAKDADDLYQKMRAIARLSREERISMGIAAREKMEREFDRNEVVHNSIQVLFR